MEPFTFNEVKEFLTSYVGGFPNCYECHDAEGADLPYVFKEDDTIYEQLTTKTIARCGDRKLVAPGDADNSALYLVLEGTCGTVGQMPSGCYESEDGSINYCVPFDDRERLRLWIQAGAPSQ